MDKDKELKAPGGATAVNRYDQAVIGGDAQQKEATGPSLWQVGYEAGKREAYNPMDDLLLSSAVLLVAIGLWVWIFITIAAAPS